MSSIEGPTPPPSDDPPVSQPADSSLVVPPPVPTDKELGEMLIQGRIEEFNRRRPDKPLVFVGLEFNGQTLHGANLSESTFERCTFQLCSITDTNLDKVKFTNSLLTKTYFDNCKGEYTRFTDSKIRSCRFFSATMPNAQFERVSLAGTRFARASLPEAHFQHCSMSDINFDEIDGEGSKWFQCDIAYSTYRGANLRGALLVQSRFTDLVITKADLRDLRLSSCYFAGVFSIHEAIVAKGVFQQSMFEASTWRDGDALHGIILPENAPSPTITKSVEKPTKPRARIDGIPGTDSDLYADAMTRLGKLVGLEEVKREIEGLAAVLRINKQREHIGLPTTSAVSHYVFAGPPGTGKTTVARILGDVLKSLGYLSKGQFVETNRSGLVGRYLGETAVKTQHIVDSAVGGVLFIDEAYTLAPSNDLDSYAQEAIATLLKLMEDKREDLVVIAAGYGPEMQRFIDANPGLQSRFSENIQFKSFSKAALSEIFAGLMATSEFIADEETIRGVSLVLEMLKDKTDSRFGNARVVRNLFEKMARRQSLRLVKENGPIDKARFSTFVFDDIPCREMLNIQSDRFRKMLTDGPADPEETLGVFTDPKLKFKGYHFPT